MRTQHLVMRSWRSGPMRAVSLATALIVVMTIVPHLAGAADFTLGIGDELFWNGEEIDFAEVPNPAQCDVTAECYEYELEVAPGDPGTRLRVALSAQLSEQESSFRPWPDLVFAPAFENVFTLQLFAPSDPQQNDPVAQDTTYNGSGSALVTGYAIEVFVGGNNDQGDPVSAPEAGTWTIRVIPESVVDMAFRMRAKLEAPAPDPQGVLYPNLRVIPPFELGFPLATAQGGPGVPNVSQSRSCMASELTEPAENDVLAGHHPDPADVPTLCLRYSMGLENAGDGLLRLLQKAPAWRQNVVEGARWFFGLDEIPLVQLICNFKGGGCQDAQSDNPPVGRFHARHAHYHFQNAFFFQLYEFPEDWKRGDPQPQLSEVGEGRKMGLMPTPETMADWGRFYHLPRKFHHVPDDSECGEGGPCGELALQAGWGDAYEWNRDGNYVDFPQSPALSGIPKEGFYLLRGTADFAGQVVESNEDDNASYAFFEVASNGKVELIERGYGTDPWDPSKVVLTVAP